MTDNGNRLAIYYMGEKYTSEPWVYNSTPLPNPSGNTGVMLCMCMYLTFLILEYSFLKFKEGMFKISHAVKKQMLYLLCSISCRRTA